MITQECLQKMEKDSDEILYTTNDSLVDITKINVNNKLDNIKRILQYIEDVQNPYIFKVDDIIVRVKHGNEFLLMDNICPIIIKNKLAYSN